MKREEAGLDEKNDKRREGQERAVPERCKGRKSPLKNDV